MGLERTWKIPDARQFREWIRRTRSMTTPRITQAEIAAQTGLSRWMIQQIETGGREPSLEVAALIWRVLHAACQGRLWIGVRIRRDGRLLKGHEELYSTTPSVKLRRLKPDPVRKPA
jgi:DNA-binding XRE family transcriptional regulator